MIASSYKVLSNIVIKVTLNKNSLIKIKIGQPLQLKMCRGSKEKSTVNKHFKKTEDNLFLVRLVKDGSKKQKNYSIKISAFGGILTGLVGGYLI